MRFSIPYLALLVLSACGGGLSTEADSVDGSPSGTASGPPGPSYEPTSFTAAEVAAARAACSAPHGPVFTPTTYAEYASHFVGSWYLCSEKGPDAGVADFPAASVVFTADGTAQFLGDDGQGGLVAIPGLADQGLYGLLILCQGTVVDPTYSCGTPESFYLSISVNDSESDGVGAGLFEASPARLEIQDQPFSDVDAIGTFTFWYVPLGGS